MKTTKLFLTGVLLSVAMSFMCFADDTASTSDILTALSSLTTSSTTSVSGVPSILSSIQQYMDQTQLQNFVTAFKADQASASPSTPEGFLLEYMTDHPEFAQAMKDAIEKAKKALGIDSDEALANSLVDQLDDLKKQINENDKLKDEEKKEYNDLLKKYQDMAKQMQDQIANTNNAINKAMDKLSEPQQKDPTMMIMMILMMVMMMLKGGGGGGGGGGCGK